MKMFGRRKKKTQLETLEVLQNCKKCHLILHYSRIVSGPSSAYLVMPPSRFEESINLNTFNALKRKGLIKQQKVITDSWMGTTTKWVLK